MDCPVTESLPVGATGLGFETCQIVMCRLRIGHDFPDVLDVGSE